MKLVNTIRIRTNHLIGRLELVIYSYKLKTPRIIIRWKLDIRGHFLLPSCVYVFNREDERVNFSILN